MNKFTSTKILYLIFFLSAQASTDYIYSCNVDSSFDPDTRIDLKCSFQLTRQEFDRRQFVLHMTQLTTVDCFQPTELAATPTVPGCVSVMPRRNEISRTISNIDQFIEVTYSFRYNADNAGKYYFIEASPYNLLATWEFPYNIDFVEGNVATPVRVISGSDATVQCNVVGYPINNIIWTINSKILVEENYDHISIHDSGSLINNTLIIKKAVESDSGIYSCRVIDQDLELITVRNTQVYVSKRLNVLWPIIGIFVEMIILILIIGLSKGTVSGTNKKKTLLQRSVQHYRRKQKISTDYSSSDEKD